MKKKVIAILLCMVLALAVVPGSIFAANSDMVIDASLDKTELEFSATEDQYVTLTINVKNPADETEAASLNGIAVDLPYPTANIVVTEISNSASTITYDEENGDFYTDMGDNSARICWQSGNSKPRDTNNLGVVVYKVPKGTAANTYTIRGENIELTDGDSEPIWDEDGSFEVTFTIKPAPVPVSGISVTPETASVAVEGTTSLTATISPDTASNTNVTWRSEDESIATVSGNGLNATVTGVAPGTVKIYAKTEDGGYEDYATITVTQTVALPTLEDKVYNGNPQFPENGTGYTLSGDSQTYVGTYTATATPAAGYTWTDGTTTATMLTWKITPAEQPAQVTETANLVARGDTLDLSTLVTGEQGNVTFELQTANGCTLSGTTLTSGENTGTATVAYTIYGANVGGSADAEYKDKSGTITVTITDAPMYTVTVPEVTGGEGAATPESGYEGDSVHLSATADDGYKFVRWDVTGATPENATSAETNITLGNTNVTATPVFEEIKPTSVSASSDKDTLIVGTDDEDDAKASILADVGPEGALNKDVTYTSSDPSIATVDEDGNVTAVGGPGTVTITVTSKADPSVKDTVTITVKKAVEKPVPKTDLVYNGKEQTGVEAGEGYTFTADSTTKATNAGSYDFVAQLKDGYVWKDGTANDFAGDWGIAQATLTNDNLELAVGESKDLADEEGVSYEAPEETNDGVIELDGNKVTGLKEGTAEIIVSSDGSGNFERGTATITVTVTKTPATGDHTLRYVGVGMVALIIMMVAVFYRRKEEK